MVKVLMPKPIWMYDKTKPFHYKMVSWCVVRKAWYYTKYEPVQAWFHEPDFPTARLHPSHFYTEKDWDDHAASALSDIHRSYQYEYLPIIQNPMPLPQGIDIEGVYEL